MKNELKIHSDVDNNVLSALKNTLYPDADEESINMVLSYCKALKMDPMQKPVHLVRMGDGTMTVMPGIGFYRIQADSTGVYAGITKPKYGKSITKSFTIPAKTITAKNGKQYSFPEKTISVTYPEWCEITVKKIVQGKIARFTAKEYWEENYAPISKDDIAPNATWVKRRRSQLAKCTEAQALRKAFPRTIGSQPTAEEMEGKSFDDFKDITTSSTIRPRSNYVSDVMSVNAPPPGFKFIELDGTVLEEMDTDKAIEHINAKILALYTNEDLEAYKEWKKLNKEQLDQLSITDKKILNGSYTMMVERMEQYREAA